MAKKIPKTTASTQAHLDIEEIIDDLVILKTGWVALVLSTTAVNFDLLSEAEQDATIYAFGALLNSLSFPLQILIRSKKADITSYFQSLEEAERTQVNPDLRRQIQKYKEFIQLTVQRKTVLDKKFYLVITFSPMEIGIKGVGKKTTVKAKNSILGEAKSALAPKREHIVKQMARLGLNTKQLTTQELIELFYDIYNPAPTGTQRVLLDTESYTTPIVEPAVEIPSPAPQAKILDLAQQQAPQNQTGLAPASPQIPQNPGIRPVQPQPETPMNINLQPPPAQQVQISSDQQNALNSLRQATSAASGFLNRPQDTQPGQAASQPQQQSVTSQSLPSTQENKI